MSRIAEFPEKEREVINNEVKTQKEKRYNNGEISVGGMSVVPCDREGVCV